MNKKSIGAFCVAISCLVAGALCHGLRVSENPMKFKIGVIAGILMIVAASSFAIAGIIVAAKAKNSRSCGEHLLSSPLERTVI